MPDHRAWHGLAQRRGEILYAIERAASVDTKVAPYAATDALRFVVSA